jgi:membrane glycosyltransferase
MRAFLRFVGLVLLALVLTFVLLGWRTPAYASAAASAAAASAATTAAVGEQNRRDRAMRACIEEKLTDATVDCADKVRRARPGSVQQVADRLVAEAETPAIGQALCESVDLGARCAQAVTNLRLAQVREFVADIRDTDTALAACVAAGHDRSLCETVVTNRSNSRIVGGVLVAILLLAAFVFGASLARRH